METTKPSAGGTGAAEELPVQMLAEQHRTWRRILSLPRVLELAHGTRVGSTPADVVYRKHKLKLLHYRRATPATHDEPLLLCYALINRPYILDLQPDKSVVARYLEQGFDVYLIDWGVPGDDDRELGLQEYVCGFLAGVVDFILQRHRRSSLHLLGYCMGGTLGALYGALMPERLSTLTLLAAPIDFAGRETLLSVWTDRKHFDVDGFIDAHGNCPAWFLQCCFQIMKPIQNFLEKNLSFYEGLDAEPRVIATHFAMERWINDNIPVAGRTFREFVKNLYQQNELVRGELQLGQQRIDLGRITCPLLVMAAKKDHLVDPASTLGILPHVGSRDVETLTIAAGHVGLVVGGEAHRTTWPQATRWLAARSTPLQARASL
jgi:polyhydroxyalkanoate synthase